MVFVITAASFKISTLFQNGLHCAVERIFHCLSLKQKAYECRIELDDCLFL